MNRFLHGHLPPATRVWGDEEEERAGRFGIMFNLGLTHPHSLINHPCTYFHYFHPHPSPWGIPRIWMLPLTCSCAETIPQDLVFQLLLIFMFMSSVAKERKEGAWVGTQEAGEVAFIRSRIFPLNFQKLAPGCLGFIFWLLAFLWLLFFHLFLSSFFFPQLQ